MLGRSTQLGIVCILLALSAGCAKLRRARETVDAGADLPPCQTDPEPLLELRGSGLALAVGDDAIYLGRDAIWRMEKRAGAELQRFAESPARVTRLAVVGDTLFWTTASTSPETALLTAREPLGVTTALRFAAGAEHGLEGARAVALAPAGELVVAAFSLEPGLSRLVRVTRDTERVVPYFDLRAPGRLELVADDERVYARVEGAIGAWDESGLLYDTASRGEKLAADSRFIYWRSETTGAPPRFMRAAKETLTPMDLGEAPDHDGLLATDDDSEHIYWADPTGNIQRTPKAGGAAELIGATGPFDDDDYDVEIALDTTSVYWIGGVDGRRSSEDDPVWLYRVCK